MDLKKPSAFEQEWRESSPDVRAEPSRFLPPPKLQLQGGLVPTRLVQPLKFNGLQQVLPPVPRT